MPPKTKIFVGKLPQTVKDAELRKLFERYGEVTECSILGSYAFVHMKTEEQSETAIQNLNNWELHGFKISVEPSTGEKRAGGGRGGGRGGEGGRGGRGGFRGGRGGPMRGGRGGRMGPYDRRPPMDDRYGPIRNGYYDDYDRRDRRPMDRRPPAGRDMYRDPYDRYDAYERMPPMRRTPPMDRRPPPPAPYEREDPYMYGRGAELDPYAGKEMYGYSRSAARPVDSYPGPSREMPPRRY